MESEFFDTAITQNLRSPENLIILDLSVFEWEGA